VAAVDGVCAGAGAILAMASDLRLGTPAAKVAFLFNRVGLAGCDMGACAMLPRIIGQGRAAELLYTGRVLGGEEAERWGFFNRLVAPEAVRVKALAEAGFLKAVGPAEHGGLHPRLDVRTLCLARDILAFRDGLADFAFAMQGLGTGSISLFGASDLQARYLPPVRDGRAIAA